MGEILKNYHTDKDKLNKLKLKDYPYLKVGNILATQIWKVHTCNPKEIIKKLLSIILCDKYVYEYKPYNQSSMIMLNASAGMLRGDNELIMRNALSFMEPCTEINITKCNKLALNKVCKKIKSAWGYFNEIEIIDSTLSRWFYAVSLVLLNELSKDFDEKIVGVSLLVTFMDSDLFENYLTQTVQHFGGKVAALQHGQRFYIPEPCDSYVGMDNLTADYKLVWSKFSRQQFMNAGYGVERLPIIGSTKYLDTPKKSMQSNKIAVFLDGPFTYGSKESNKKMLDFTTYLAGKNMFSLLVKPHPVDDIENYEIGDKEVIELVSPKIQINELSEDIMFGIVHTSGVAIDLLILDVPVLIYDSGEYFPIDLPSKYFFKNMDELAAILLEWKNNPEAMIEEFEQIRSNYIEQNPRKLHSDFFSSFKGEPS